MRYALLVPTVPSAPASMSPHDVVGGCTPNPRNDSVDSATTAAATPNVALTTIGPIVLGRMGRTMIHAFDAPEARAASTNSFSFSDSPWARTMRAMYIQPSAASTAMIVVSWLPNLL